MPHSAWTRELGTNKRPVYSNGLGLSHQENIKRTRKETYG
jgi:hypothetical protein